VATGAIVFGELDPRLQPSWMVIAFVQVVVFVAIHCLQMIAVRLIPKPKPKDPKSVAPSAST